MVMLTACASVPTQGTGNDAPAENTKPTQIGNTLLVIGGLVLLGAVIANEVDDNIEDAVRDGASSH